MHTIAHQQEIDGRKLVSDTFRDIGAEHVSLEDVRRIVESARSEYNSLNPSKDAQRKYDGHNAGCKAQVELFLMHIQQAIDRAAQAARA